MTETGKKQTVKPWHWPAEWMRDQSFWRDVASRTLATAFAAFLAYLFALVAGYVSQPNLRRTILAVGLTAAVYFGFTIFSRWYAKRHPLPSEGLAQASWPELSRGHKVIVAMGTVAAIAAIAYMLGVLIFGWTMP